MTNPKYGPAVTAMAAILALATAVETSAAAAQSGPGGYQDNGYPNNGYPNNGAPPPPPNGQGPSGYQGGQYQGNQNQGGQYQGDQSQGGQYQSRAGGPAPPPGQYAPPPTGYERPGAAYDGRAQQYDREYADRYSRWAAQYCIDRRNDNTAAGAVIGGVLGAIIGSSVAGRGDRGAGAFVGGALGVGTGAIIGSQSSGPGGCPPGYYARSGAPTFVYGGPAYGVVTGPSWYNPWVWSGGAWVYRPYRYWYFTNASPYWQPGWRPGYYRYHYRHW